MSEKEKLALGLGLGLGIPFLAWLLWIWGSYSISGTIRICGCTLYESEMVRNLRYETPSSQEVPYFRSMLTLTAYQNLIQNQLTRQLTLELDSIRLRSNGATHLRDFQEHAREKGAHDVALHIQNLLEGMEV